MMGFAQFIAALPLIYPSFTQLRQNWVYKAHSLGKQHQEMLAGKFTVRDTSMHQIL
jgi:hypothetical protein